MVAIKRVPFRIEPTTRYAVYDDVGEEWYEDYRQEDGTFTRADEDSTRVSDCFKTLEEAQEAMDAYNAYIAKYWSWHGRLDKVW